jgi:hypothetical protein
MYLFFRKIGASWVSDRGSASAPFELLAGSFDAAAFDTSTWANSSFEVEEEQPPARARPDRRHQLRMREALVDVLVDDVRLVRMRSRSTRIGTSLYGFISAMSSGLANSRRRGFEVHALFEEHETAAVR